MPGSTAPIAGLTSVLGTFQRIFTTIYDALERGPKKKAAKNSDKAIADTSLGFAYTFPGSVGVMMTLPNERFLFESKLDAAMEKNPAKLPKIYRATLNIMEKIVIDDTGEEQIDYFLVRLDEPDEPGIFLTALSDPRDS